MLITGSPASWYSRRSRAMFSLLRVAVGMVPHRFLLPRRASSQLELPQQASNHAPTGGRAQFEQPPRQLAQRQVGPQHSRPHRIPSREFLQQVPQVLGQLRTGRASWLAAPLFFGPDRLPQTEIDSDGGGIDQTITYGYDPNGIRVRQLEGNEESIYLVDYQSPTGQAEVLEEVVRNATTQSLIRELTYLLGSDVLAQTRSDVLSGAPLYLLYDGHGSTRGLVDATGQPLSDQVYAYDAYGNPLGFDSAAAYTRFLYSGEQTDNATGLQYLRARYYDPAHRTVKQLRFIHRR